ncbi:CARDB domain-containing protein [Nannocystis sp. SCPEA4]|uniref:CARDB domain-containing protein n=1 Tax=Nannocystis sp. SCPEA4 TaxID=2996787 RepID=UPI00226E80D8|nr:CARDB domain-containing protein [Nannocystis sp. SCPEA4]MCY1059201.1 hypothetical protein [Nannocystis sp. SCPEA4]
MITSFNHVHPWIFLGLFVMALAACPQDKAPGTTDDPESEDTTSGASTSTTTVAPTSSGPPSTTTGETTAPSGPGTTSTSPASTTTLDPDTTTGGDFCPVDLTPSLALGFDQCDESLVLTVTVHNVGTVDEVPAGVDVTFYEGTDASGVKLGTKPTFEPLPPGSSTDVVWVLVPPADESSDYYVEVDSGPSGGSIVECDENNNSALVTDAACPD